jgi:chemotaxis signal transduction protein
VLWAGARVLFVPVEAVVKLAPVPELAPIPGVTAELLGVGLVDGEAVPVLAIGAAREHMIVCTHAGERIAVVGHARSSAGFFAADPEGAGVIVEGARAEVLDLAALAEGVQRTSRGGRIAG